ncbi:MAG: SpoIIE family protein phosphatase [Lachnospiraceae bacterium]|nr:SpoIIE family protein phosphatase [Lachnospiraceae bacterium]
MKIIWGFKVGGLQQKIINLILNVLAALIALFVVVSLYQQNSLNNIVKSTSEKQQDAISTTSENTMKAVIDASMSQSTSLQGSVTDSVFSDMKENVLMLQAYATGLFEKGELHRDITIQPPDKSKDGTPTIQLLHEYNVNPEDSNLLPVISVMGDVMLSMFENTEAMNGCYIATADGNLMFVNDRSATYVKSDGTLLNIDVRRRQWYLKAVETGELVFTGVELDSGTEIPTLEIAAPIYRDGELVAVVGADIFLDSVKGYVNRNATKNNFICILNEKGQVIFSPQKEGCFEVKPTTEAESLLQSDNKRLATLVEKSLKEQTKVELVAIDGKDYYISGVPLSTVGWTILSVTDSDAAKEPTKTMLDKYETINNEAFNSYEKKAKRLFYTFLAILAVVIVLAVTFAAVLSKRVVKPLEKMTMRINALREGDTLFVMEDDYCTGDEIEILAQTFATISERTQNYIKQITHITAEKERIGTELELATRIQADMLPNIYPAFPERSEFDVYATMTPAKEVGGDFYDFFMIDDDHLGLVIADVSGKGVPAALFMMISKILVQNFAMTGRTPSQVLESVNDQICSNNKEGMFVTVWFGILTISTGKLLAANAGHEYPVLTNENGEFALVKGKHGFVIGGMEHMKYKEFELDLSVDSRLFVYTDGVPEATNAEGEMFGTDRMLAALNKDSHASPEKILANVREAVDGFVKEAEQFDDLTMLCLEYKGKQQS